METLEQLQQFVIDGKAKETQATVAQAIQEGIPAEQILNQGLIAAMAKVGAMFETGDIYVPEMLVAARAMKGGLALLRPKLIEANVQAVGKAVIGTVQGDLHDIGKNLVAMMLEGAGFEVIDLGTSVPPEKFVEAIRTHQPQLVGFSALLTTTMPKMKTNIEAIKAAGLRDQVKIMVGGAPVTPEYAAQIGADVFARDASSAANRAKEAIGVG